MTLPIKHRIYTRIVRPGARFLLWTFGPLVFLLPTYAIFGPEAAIKYNAAYLLILISVGIILLARELLTSKQPDVLARSRASNLLALLCCFGGIFGAVFFPAMLIFLLFIFGLLLLVLYVRFCMLQWRLKRQLGLLQQRPMFQPDRGTDHSRGSPQLQSMQGPDTITEVTETGTI
jgi:hypothetical protein